MPAVDGTEEPRPEFLVRLEEPYRPPEEDARELAERLTEVMTRVGSGPLSNLTSGPPSNPVTGQLWDDGNRQHAWNGDSWVLLPLTRLQLAGRLRKLAELEEVLPDGTTRLYGYHPDLIAAAEMLEGMR